MSAFFEWPNSLPPVDKATVKHTGATMQMPVYIGTKLNGSDKYLLPLEPTISVRGKNIIVRRQLMKRDRDLPSRQGTIKELWATDDFELTISGTLYNDEEESLPIAQMSRLKALCTESKPIYFESALTVALGFSNIAVTEFEFPATKGIRYQDYVIKAFSDQAFELLG